VPRIPVLDTYLAQKSVPGGTHRNWDSYGAKIGTITDYQKFILADPQTSGGLLIAVEEGATGAFEAQMRGQGYELTSFGYLKTPEVGKALIEVIA
jgi:selenide,water dikinase